MAIVMRCEGLAGFTLTGQTDSPKGWYLKSYDPEAHDGQGDSDWTPDLKDALRFPTVVEAHACWTQVPKNRPVRPWDGRPNRPLTAFNVSMMDEEDA